jgi:hypothetical protein
VEEFGAEFQAVSPSIRRSALIDPAVTSLICPNNDMETKTICDLGRKYGLHVIEVSGEWGIKLGPRSLSSQDMSALRENVIIVELPGEEAVQVLRAAGKRVYRVDHHDYGGGRTSAAGQPSSLEQFARLIGHDLTRNEWEIAINDRDFLPGLSRAGVSYGRALRLRQQELEIRHQETNMDEAIQYVQKHARDLDDLRLVLAPESLSGVMLEAAQYPDCAVYEKAAAAMRAVALKPTLVLYHAENAREHITGLSFAGPVKERAWLAGLINEPVYAMDFEMWLGGGQHGCFFGARARPHHPAPAVDDLVSRLLENLLSSGRPLRTYTCTFHLPLDLYRDEEVGKSDAPFEKVSECNAERHCLHLGTVCKNSDKADPQKAEQLLEAQAYHYFLPNLRQFIYETVADGGHHASGVASPKPIEHWRLKDAAGMQLTLACKGNNGPATSAKVDEVGDMLESCV